MKPYTEKEIVGDIKYGLCVTAAAKLLYNMRYFHDVSEEELK